ncbi:hypothetical protein BLS_008945 [Venturia inaequalis]|uniref:peptidylprolyl isomerase n=1 Tax=Venturia inaequalis TaxID=5025 RepID=A0A8H3UYF0_VENIN|nr:hypothetical protein EG328_001734 [Venturia inaequalis]KAE9980230.1 hypothetical protein BLS_008945 [Venturia inaequalis]KAE9989585.1 hypothetical protein EG327_002504 [Venturia inaequalis]RDI81474.1 hypothetical protein Vi05172_g8628 [Venturia inaequalis]
MSAALRPVAIYGLEVPCGDMAVDGNPEQFNASYRITMAAIDPTATPQTEDDSESAPPPRATLKMIRLPVDESDDEADEDFEDDDIESIRRRLGITDEDEDAETSDEEINGGPGEKTKKAREEAIKKALDKEGMDIDIPNGVNGTKLDKGKAKASDDESEADSESDDGAPDMDEFVICTLDSRQTYQQPLDILINAGEHIYFKVTGAYDIHLTGNFVVPENEITDSDEESDDEEEMGDYSLDDLLAGNEGDFSGDELDDLEDPRIMEVDSEEEAPKLVKSKKEEKKNKKRAADDSDEEISKDAIKKLLKTEDPTEKLSKKQKKKLKNNAGEATEAPKAESKPADKKAAKEVKGEKDAASANGSGKQVKFADKLEQGPTPTKADNNKGPKAWTVSGVKIDQRKAGSGPGAKKGDKVGMRYIGKLKDGKQFDANTKGEPFKFKLGHGDVIKGWDIGVQGMCVGSERRIVVPAQHAYGSKKLPGIPPNSELTFDLKLISLN